MLEREGVIDKLASFDPGFDAVADFVRIRVADKGDGTQVAAAWAASCP